MDWFPVRARLWEARVWWWCLGWNARPWQLGAEWATWSARTGQWNGKWNYQAKMLCWSNLCRPCCEISTVETLLRYGFPIYTNVTWTIVYDRFCGRVDVWLPPASWRFFGLDQSLKGVHRFRGAGIGCSKLDCQMLGRRPFFVVAGGLHFSQRSS